MGKKTGDGAKGNIRSPKCPFCGEDWDEKHNENEDNKCPNSNACGGGADAACGWGNIGIGGDLAKHIERKSKKKKSKHPLAYNGTNLQAHHLVCSEALNDDDGMWALICFLTGYNINCYKNGVFLPSLLELACLGKVPLHKGGHAAGFGGVDRYSITVVNEVNAIKNEYSETNICQNKEKLKNVVTKLNQKSESIFNKIKSFAWTITWDGFDYQDISLIGCSNQTSIQDKQGTRRVDIIKEDGTKGTKQYDYSDEEKVLHEVLSSLKDEREAIQQMPARNTTESDTKQEAQNKWLDKIRQNEVVQCKCGRSHPELKLNLERYDLKQGEF